MSYALRLPRLQIAILVCAALISTDSPATAADHDAGIKPRILIQKDEWGAPKANIEKVLYSTAEQILPYFHDRTLEPILVTRSRIVPMTLDQRGPHGQFQVQLATGDTYWIQYSYQFAHELCHVLAATDHPHRGRHQWFEESLCETSSLFALSKMHVAWELDPPYPNWETWGVHFDEYLNALLAEPARRLPPDQTMAQWLSSNLPELEKEKKVTVHSKLTAAYLLPIFQEEPQGWETITWLNAGANEEKLGFEEHLRAWRNRVPEKHKAFVGKIQKLFGFKP